MTLPIPNYARLLELKLIELGVEIKPMVPSIAVPHKLIGALAPNGRNWIQHNIIGIVEDFGSENIIKLADYIKGNYKSIACTALICPNGLDAEIQVSGDVVIRVLTDYVIGSYEGDPYEDKFIRRVDILLHD